MKTTHLCLLALLFLASTMLGCTAEPAKIPPPADVGGVPENATTLPSGLAYKVLREGTGERHPGPTSTVKVHYTGWTTDGEMFDSSVSRGEPISLGLDQVIAGWQEGVQLMVVGEQRRFWIPSNLAYEGQSGAPQGMLVFDIELLDIED
jgi:peptidylprolyl isomerase